MLVYALLILLPAALNAQSLDVVLEGLLDLNKDGKITLTEAETYFMTYDSNNDHVITLEEFVAAVDKVDPAITGHEEPLYKLFDRDGTGLVNKADIDNVFITADFNKDGVVENSELKQVIDLVSIYVG